MSNEDKETIHYVKNKRLNARYVGTLLDEKEQLQINLHGQNRFKNVNDTMVLSSCHDHLGFSPPQATPLQSLVRRLGL
jgi:hypothetical protein